MSATPPSAPLGQTPPHKYTVAELRIGNTRIVSPHDASRSRIMADLNDETQRATHRTKWCVALTALLVLLGVVSALTVGCSSVADAAKVELRLSGAADTRGQRCLVGFVECMAGPLVRHFADDPLHCASLYSLDGWPEHWTEGATVDLADVQILQNNFGSMLLWLGVCNDGS